MPTPHNGAASRSIAPTLAPNTKGRVRTYFTTVTLVPKTGKELGRSILIALLVSATLVAALFLPVGTPGAATESVRFLDDSRGALLGTSVNVSHGQWRLGHELGARTNGRLGPFTLNLPGLDRDVEIGADTVVSERNAWAVANEMLGADFQYGLYVETVSPGSEAAALGVLPGDVLAFPGYPTAEGSPEGHWRALHRTGQPIVAELWRTDQMVGSFEFKSSNVRSSGITCNSKGGYCVPVSTVGPPSEARRHYDRPRDGDSAGLALTLAYLEWLTGATITGDLRVAATGTIEGGSDRSAYVGDVGSVPLKATAAADADVDLFLVPTYQVAEVAADVTVVGVSNAYEAVAQICQARSATEPNACATLNVLLHQPRW